MKEKIKEIQTPWENYKEASSLSILLFFGGFIILAVVVAVLFGITMSAVIILCFSAFFAGYLAVAFTTHFEIGKSAKIFSMLLFIIGIIMLFISLGWWGIFGIPGYYFLLILSMAFWQKRLRDQYGSGLLLGNKTKINF